MPTRLISKWDPEVYGADIDIEGAVSNGGGGGGVHNGVFFRSIVFPQLPTGVLTVKVYNLISCWGYGNLARAVDSCYAAY